MITYQISIEELRPGCIAMDSKPIAKNPTDLEKVAAGEVNEGIITLLTRVMQSHRGGSNYSEIIANSTPELDQTIEARKRRIREGGDPA